MLGPAFCFTVLDRAVDALKSGDTADQTKAHVIENNRAFAYLGALGPLLREHTPLDPADYAEWEETATLQEALGSEGISGLEDEELNRLITLHRRALMVGYAALFEQVQVQWPLLADARALLDELDAIAADEDLLALNAKQDEIAALGDALEGAQSADDDDGDDDGGEDSEEVEPFGFEEERILLDELNVLFRPFLQSEPTPEAIAGDGPEDAAAQTFLMTLPMTWRESELMRWRASGDYARALLANAGDDARLQAYAYGYMIHVASAVTSQPFLNAIAGGPPRSHWWRHRLVTNFVDSWVWGYYAAGAQMAGDTPDPPYEDWPELCSAKLHERIDLDLGLEGLGFVDAVLGVNADGGEVASPSSADLDVLAEFLSATSTEVYEEFGPSDLIPLDIGHDFSPHAFRRAYLGLSAVLWLHTSGEGPVCAHALERQPPGDCFDNPPSWVQEIDSPPEPSKHKGALAGSIILAILALLSLLSGGLAAGLAALAAAAGTAVVTSNTFWNELRCTLYWTRYLVHEIELKTAEFLVETTLAPPAVVRLGGIGDIGGTPGPVRGSQGRPLTRTTIPDAGYPRGLDRGPADGPYAPDIGYRGYPIHAQLEEPVLPIWPSIGANRYPSFALDGEGQWILQNGGIVAPVSFPSSTGSASEQLYYGNSVDNAVEVLRNEAESLANFNLDADRGYGWLAWETTLPDLPSQPPFDADDAS